jgi:hypothetical protein
MAIGLPTNCSVTSDVYSYFFYDQEIQLATFVDMGNLSWDNLNLANNTYPSVLLLIILNLLCVGRR